jgi:hypothetical protein
MESASWAWVSCAALCGLLIVKQGVQSSSRTSIAEQQPSAVYACTAHGLCRSSSACTVACMRVVYARLHAEGHATAATCQSHFSSAFPVCSSTYALLAVLLRYTAAASSRVRSWGWLGIVTAI